MTGFPHDLATHPSIASVPIIARSMRIATRGQHFAQAPTIMRFFSQGAARIFTNGKFETS
jgi:hypothetical protein